MKIHVTVDSNPANQRKWYWKEYTFSFDFLPEFTLMIKLVGLFTYTWHFLPTFKLRFPYNLSKTLSVIYSLYTCVYMCTYSEYIYMYICIYSAHIYLLHTVLLSISIAQLQIVTVVSIVCTLVVLKIISNVTSWLEILLSSKLAIFFLGEVNPIFLYGKSK